MVFLTSLIESGLFFVQNMPKKGVKICKMLDISHNFC